VRIVIVVDRYAPEARSAAHLYEDLAKGLVQRGHEVTVVAKKPTENLPDGSAIPGKEVKDGVRVVRMRSYLGEPRSTLVKGLDQVLLAFRVWIRLRFIESPDVVLVYSPPLPLAAACAASGHPLVVNLHDLYPRTAVELGRLSSPILIAMAERVEEFVYSRAHRFIVPAPDSVRYLTVEKRVPFDRVKLCYNWVDFKATLPGDGLAFRREHGLEGKFVATYAGLVGIAQDLSAVVAAAKMARGEPDVVFLVIGEGSELEHWKSESAGVMNLRFLPTLPREKYLDALRASDVCLLALSGKLRSPAIPGKLQNIMAVAKPVLAVVPADSAAACTVLEAGCGIVTEPGNGDALLAALKRIRADKQSQVRWGEAGMKFARIHFSLDCAVSSFERTLRECSLNLV
jgi:glycosyltransferase involved in cell wall biosynthesis